MEQEVYIKMDAAFHSALHKKQVEHEHAGKKSPLYIPRWGGETVECIKVTISFDEAKVAGWLDLSPEHQYDFSREIALPNLKEGNLQYDAYHSRIDISNIAVGREIQWAIEKAIVARMDINSLLSDILAKHAMIDSPEAKALIAEAERQRAEERDEEDARRKAKDEAERQKQEAYAKDLVEKETAKKAWIEANGSERLKLGVARGYNCEKLYTLELCDSLPENFALDYDNKVRTKERSCPSLAALQLCEELEKAELPFVAAITVVWLPCGLNDLLSDEDRYLEGPPRGGEAIEIKVNGHYAYHLMA
ncbi:MAG: hypothetical protein A4E49_00301 [Methanosaeta sp. PtaU1.Bin112]|nr:MAG: hypothetical protein A4E49_00301 [Methanosaeta sp. PtaU1.Bin112]